MSSSSSSSSQSPVATTTSVVHRRPSITPITNPPDAVKDTALYADHNLTYIDAVDAAIDACTSVVLLRITSDEDGDVDTANGLSASKRTGGIESAEPNCDTSCGKGRHRTSSIANPPPKHQQQKSHLAAESAPTLRLPGQVAAIADRDAVDDLAVETGDDAMAADDISCGEQRSTTPNSGTPGICQNGTSMLFRYILNSKYY